MTERQSRVLPILFAAFLVCASPTILMGQSRPDAAPGTAQPQAAEAPGSGSTAGESQPDTDASKALTAEEIQRQKGKIAESQELSEDVKAKIVETYDKALAQLKSASELETRRQQYSQQRNSAPANLAKTKELLEAQEPAAKPEISAEITLTEAEQALATARLNLEEARKNVAKWELEPKTRADRRTKIPEESNSARQKLEEVAAELAAPAAEGQ
ncbi:MAG: hypothetical protein ACYS8Z_25320, partial [Planctomycetota bacterium]